MLKTCAKYAYLHNLQGDIVGIVDTNGNEAVKYTYDAWGKVLSATGSLASTLGNIQPFRYRGYVYDVETGLYYLRSRYYNPAWGRFINADSIIRGNLFSYCNNLVVRLHDPDGHDAIWITEERNVGTMGHTSMLFRDEEDSSWYYFYWGPRHSQPSDSAIIFMERIDIEIIDGVFINLEKLNDGLAKIHETPRSYSSAFYFKGGDFGPSIEYAKELKDKYNSNDEKVYNLFARNCMQMSADVMIKSIEDQDLEKFLIWIANQIIPSAVVPLFRGKTKLPETRIDPLLGTYHIRK